MQESKFIQLLNALNTRERSRFRDYIHSPFFNKHDATKELFDYISQFSPPFDDQRLDKKTAYKVLFPKEKYDEQRIYTLLSNLLNLMSGFLTQLQLEEKTLLQKRLAMWALRKRHQDKQWGTVEKQYKLLAAKMPFQDENSLYEQYRYFEEVDALFLDKELRTPDENIQHKSNALDAFYIAAKLKTACDMQSRNIVIKANYESWALEDLLLRIKSDQAQADNNRNSAHPAVVVYHAILKMLRSGAEADYFEVKQLLANHLSNFSKEELKLQYDYVINYVIRQLNSSRPDWYKEFLDLHQFLLAHEILLLDGELPEWDYKNIVTVALRLDEFDWVEGFIHRYRNSVKNSVRENVFNYNLASLFFARKQYKEALQLLLQVDFTDSSYHLGAKIIQLKSYYVLQEWEAALSLIEAFRNLVQRDKILSEYRHLSNLNMLKVAKKLVLLAQEATYLSPTKLNKGIASLEKALQKSQPLANLDWLVEAIDDLKKINRPVDSQKY